MVLRAWCDDTWTLVYEEPNLKVYNMPGADESQLAHIKGQLHDSIPIEIAAQVLLDVSGYKDWIGDLKESHVVARISDDDFILYSRFQMTWPFQDRDVYLHITITRDYQHGIFSGHLEKVSGPAYPTIPGVVRLPSMDAKIKVFYLNRQITEGEFIETTDVGGVFPKFIKEYMNKQVPHEVLDNLRKACRIPKIRDAASHSNMAKLIEQAIDSGSLHP
jgi:hypothetical protein